MVRKSVAKSKVGCVRTTEDVWKRFQELADGWGETYAQAFERLVVQAENRNTRKNNKGDEHGR